MTDTTEFEAAAFRRLRSTSCASARDVQNIDLMILAGFCRNCLSDWYREAAEAAASDGQGRGPRSSLRHAVRRMEGETSSRTRRRNSWPPSPRHRNAMASFLVIR